MGFLLRQCRSGQLALASDRSEPQRGKICNSSHCHVFEVPRMVAREEGLVLPERAEGLPEPGHASGLRCWRRHGLEASRQQGEQPWVASHSYDLAAARGCQTVSCRRQEGLRLEPLDVAGPRSALRRWQCPCRFRQAVAAVGGSVVSKPYDCHAGCWATSTEGLSTASVRKPRRCCV